MSDYGVVSTINPPCLDNVRQESLIKFDNDYTRYVDKVKQINQGRTASNRVTPSSIRQCMDATLLNTLCIIGKIENAQGMEDATDQSVQKWFDDQIALAPEDMTERVRSALDSVTYRVNSKDPSGAALDFVVKVVSALDRNNASEVVRDKESCKSLITRMINKVEPPELKERIRESKEVWTSEQKSDISYFQERLSSFAVQVNQGELARARINKRGQKRKFSDIGDNRNRPRSNEKVSLSKQRNTISGSRSDKDTWNLPCLNKEKCSEIHRIMDCPVTSEDRKKELLSEAREKSRKKRALSKNIKKLSTDRKTNVVLPDPEMDRFEVYLQGTFRTVALGDTGSDENVIDEKRFSKIAPSLDISHIESFDCPIVANLAINTEHSTKCTISKKILVSITITLPGSNLPLRVHNVPFLVVEQDMDEAIIGRTFLRKIGFNLHDHLLRARCKIDNKKFEELNAQDIKIAALSYQGLQYNATEDDPIPPVDSAGATIGKDSKEEMGTAVSDILINSQSNGLSKEGYKKMSSLLNSYNDILRIRLCDDPPAKVAPLHIRLRPGARAHRATQRRYALKQRAFLADTVRKLEKVGAIYKNPQARWASPALAVSKSGSEEFRFTVDLRVPNSQTEPIASAMPHLESCMQSIAGSKVFAKIDMAHAYWQLPLAEESQEIMSIQTPLGVYSSTRLLQGSTDAGNHFQSVTSEAFSNIQENLLQWVDDFIIHATTETKLLNIIESFFNTCRTFGFKINAKKTKLFCTEAKFCGRIISQDGMKFDPSKVDTLKNMHRPTRGNELQQFLCATNWMRNAIPNYAKKIAPLHILLEQVFKLAGGRTKKASGKVVLSGLWGRDHDAAFSDIKQQIAHSTTLGFPKPNYSLCLFTDASESHWSAVLTQVPSQQTKREPQNQDHEPLSFLSGAFTGSAEKWSVPEKEGFAIVESMCKLDYLLYGREVGIYTDHANLVYLYDPFGQNPGIARHTACKLMRWALKLSSFRYVIEHVAGDKNVWADILTRWAVNPRNNARVRALKAIILAPITPSLEDSCDWPVAGDVIQAQKAHKERFPNTFTIRDGVIQNSSGVWYVPKAADELKLRIMVAAHAGLSGHRGYKTTQRHMCKHFWWENMNSDVQEFCKSCLHCLLTNTGEIIPRPLGHALHASRPNEIIHFDFCYMTPGEQGYDYVLILKDDLSGFVWLIPATNANADTTANALLSWFSTFGTVQQWVSDRGSHFKNEVVRSLRERTNSSHHFTLAYTLWTNGTVEVVCRELLRTIRALVSEFQIPLRSWPTVLPVVQSVLNNTLLERLGNRCALTVFTGLPQDTPLSTIKLSNPNKYKLKSIQEVRACQIVNANKLLKSMDDMHKEVKFASNKKRELAIERHNKKTHVRPCNFFVGDFVLKALTTRERGNKVSVRWTGPFRVVNCKSDYLFTIEDLLTASCYERTLDGNHVPLLLYQWYKNRGTWLPSKVLS